MGEIKIRKEEGFTLIELLVVIAIIGVLIGMAVFGFQGSMEASRDTNRKSDLREYQTSLEAFANRNNGFYPSRTSSVLPSSLCTALGLSSGCPEDPRNATSYLYHYISDGSGALDATLYVLWAPLESTNGTTSFIICSNGKVGEAPAPTTNACPL